MIRALFVVVIDTRFLYVDVQYNHIDIDFKIQWEKNQITNTRTRTSIPIVFSEMSKMNLHILLESSMSDDPRINEHKYVLSSCSEF